MTVLHMISGDDPEHVTTVDIVLLTSIERVAILVHLAGHPDPAVKRAVLEAVGTVLRRTRGPEQ